MDTDYTAAGPTSAEPTTLFGGSIPGVHFAKVTPIRAASVPAVDGPASRSVDAAAGLVRPVPPGVVHAVVGTAVDLRG